MARRTKVTQLKKRRFCEELASNGGIVSAAAKAIGIARNSLYEAKKVDAGFDARWEQALKDAGDVLEDEAKRRAMYGVKRRVIRGGKIVMEHDGVTPVMETEFSDMLLALLLKAHRPGFRTERIEHVGDGGGVVRTEVTLVLPDNGRGIPGGETKDARSHRPRGDKDDGSA